ncbi:uncharacterized protein LOC121640505 isoform X2 [Melanotaenia boesemani]|uniref:uncharacterized protein LOC121640505 isoform X2 n=1 Tax=Melanotaenia boesemani TaxID=1250792 RepID=UPI001C04E6CB|nr:uncharacterized protein LOC121640505 isoform X2 [Melanotaenia boesemani]
MEERRMELLVCFSKERLQDAGLLGFRCRGFGFHLFLLSINFIIIILLCEKEERTHLLYTESKGVASLLITQKWEDFEAWIHSHSWAKVQRILQSKIIHKSDPFTNHLEAPPGTAASGGCKDEDTRMEERRMELLACIFLCCRY